MSDLVQRLRAWHTPGETITGDVRLYLDAADEIERLTRERDDFKQRVHELEAYPETALEKQLRAELDAFRKHMPVDTLQLLAERDRLRAALKRYGQHYYSCQSEHGRYAKRCTCGFTKLMTMTNTTTEDNHE